MLAFVKELRYLGTFNLRVFLIAWAVILALALLTKKLLNVKLGKLGFPILAYSLGLSAMGALSICFALCSFPNNYFFKAIMLIAPALFIVSDATLGLKFSDKERFGTLKIRYVTLITYYTAQMLFGLSITLLSTANY